MTVTPDRSQRLGLRLLTGAGAIGLSLISAANYASADGIALIMGGTGTPTPSAAWLDFAQRLYLPSDYSGFTPQALYTPEQLYPATGVDTLTLSTSVNEGVKLLDAAIRESLASGGADDDTIAVFGASQSAIIASLEMEQLVAAGESDLPLHFVLIGNEIAPNGGLLSRFSGLDLPWLGMAFYDPTPDNAFPTDMYTIEYDGFADFPRYPLNLLSDLNAVLGIFLLHGAYGNLTSEQVENAVQLATEGPTQTSYHMILTDNLPLLEPVRLLPVIGDPLADLLQPALKVLVNLGYGDPDYGYSTDPANIHTGFGLIPNVDPGTVIDAFLTGVRQGLNDAGSDISVMLSAALSDIHDALTLDPATLLNILANDIAGSISTVHDSIGDMLAVLQSIVSSVPNLMDSGLAVVSNIIDNFSFSSLTPLTDGLISAISADMSAGTALLNTFLSLAVSLPLYNVDLFMSNLADGDLLGAIGEPIAADIGLLSVASMFGVGAVGAGVQAGIDSLQSALSGMFDELG